MIVKNDDLTYSYAEGNLFNGNLSDVTYKNVNIDNVYYSLPIEKALTTIDMTLEDKLGNAKVSLNLPSQELEIHNFMINVNQYSGLFDEINAKAKLQNFILLNNGYCLKGEGIGSINVTNILEIDNLEVACVNGEIKIYHMNKEIIYFGIKDNNYYLYLNSEALPKELAIILNKQVIAVPLNL
ncbi:MAG: hypothetical protein O3C54_03460 [Proteobacteria bacterium]|nr:hypothetical protein [Pseudomonadota bacterium]